MHRLWAAVMAGLLAGCIHSQGGRGGSAVGSAESVLDAFYGQGGSGENAAGMDGCDIVELGRDVVSMCSTAFRIQEASFQVVGVNGSVPMMWSDLRLGVEEPGYALRAPTGVLSLETRTDITVEFAGAPMASTVYDGELGDLLSGAILPGQAFDICGEQRGGTVTAWLRDQRPIGAMLGIRLRAPGCDGSPWAPAAVTLEQEYRLYVTARPGQTVGMDGRNCVTVSEGVPFEAEVEARWVPQTPLSQRLEFVWWPGNGTSLAEAGASPFRARFASDGTQGALGVFPVEPGTALEQSVWLELRVTFMGSPSRALGPETGVCIR